MSKNKSANGAATNGAAAPAVNEADKANLDLAWDKIQTALRQEAEGNNLWIEGTWEIIKSLDDIRRRFVSDQEFGRALTESGYGKNRITRQDRAALLNMAQHPDLTRKALEQTNRRSWRLIWEQEIQPQLPTAGQPADTESNTRRAKKNGGKQSPKPGFAKDLDCFFSDWLTTAEKVVELQNSLRDCPLAKKLSLQQHVSSEWLEQIRKGRDALAWICDWANGSLEEEADTLLQQSGRTILTTPPHASASTQPGA